MLEFTKNPLLLGVISLAISVVLTFCVRGLARRYGFVAAPKLDRWHKRPTAMMGGVAIFLTTVLIAILFVSDATKDPQFLTVLAGSPFLFLIGLVDDVFHIKPYQKLVGQLVGVALVVSEGLVLPWTGS